MATGGVYDELSEIVTCQICLELMDGRRPRTLCCLHVFCQECLQKLLDGAGNICCPVCTQTTQVPGGSAASLPVFFYTSKLQDVQKGIEERHITCSMCKSETHKAEIASYCFSCICGHCTDCRMKHDRVYKNHSQISLSPSTFQFIICSQHDVHKSCFCMTCAKAICAQCHRSEHFEHKIYDVCYDGKNIMQELKEYLLSSLKSTKEQMENLLKLEAKVEDDIKKAVEEMTHHRDHLLKQVNDQYKSLCEELNKKQDDFKHDLMRSKELVEDATLCIEKLLKQTESWHEPVKGIPQSRIENCEGLIADVKEEVPSVDLDIIEPRIKFVNGDDDIVLGKIVDENVNVDGQPTLKYEIETEDSIRDIDYLDNGYLVVCMSKGVCVYNGRHLVPDHYVSVHCKTSENGHLCNVCVCKVTGQVVVSEYRGCYGPGYLHVYRPDGERWQYDIHEVCVKSWGVSVTSDGGYVVCSGWTLYKYNCQGQQVWEVDVLRNGWVYDVAVGDNDQILVCHQPKVVVYNQEGQQMSRLSTSVRQLAPHGVFVNKNGDIYVADRKSKEVLWFDKHGKFVKSLIHLDFVPNKLCMYHNVRLSVCDYYYTHKVCVYKL